MSADLVASWRELASQLAERAREGNATDAAARSPEVVAAMHRAAAVAIADCAAELEAGGGWRSKAERYTVRLSSGHHLAILLPELGKLGVRDLLAVTREAAWFLRRLAGSIEVIVHATSEKARQN